MNQLLIILIHALEKMSACNKLGSYIIVVNPCIFVVMRINFFYDAGKFYLVDAKYANIPGFVAPYHGIPYGLHGIPQDAKDLFNHRHSLLRSAADRSFGALKARFPILMTAPPYPLPTQVKLVVAACAIHNYIRGEKRDDLIFRMYEQESELQLEDPMPPLETEQQPLNADAQVLNIPLEEEEVEHALQLRDAIAAEIWNDYIHDFSTTSEQN